MADNIRQIRSSFNTLKNTTVTKNNKAYIPTSATDKEYITTGTANLVSDTAEAITLLAGTANSIPTYYFSGADASLNGIKSDIYSISEVVANQTADYVSSKVNRLKNLWNTKVDVTIGTLIGEVSAYAVDLETMGNRVVSRLKAVTSNITGIDITDSDSIGDVVGALGEDYLKALTADGSLTETINQLNSVKVIANSFSTAVKLYRTIAQVKKILEGFSTTFSIASDFALSFFSGGTSAIKATNTTSEVVQVAVTKLKTLLLYSAKKFLFPLKIKLPALLVGHIDSLNVRTAMLGGDSNSIWGSIFDSDFYETVKYTKEWENAIVKAISAVQTASSSVKVTVENYKKLFKTEIRNNAMQEITVKARKTARLEDFPLESIQRSLNPISSSKTMNAWNTLWGDKENLSPINSVESLIKISATLYGAKE